MIYKVCTNRGKKEEIMVWSKDPENIDINLMAPEFYI